MNAPRHTFEAYLPYAYLFWHRRIARAPITPSRHCQPFFIMLYELECGGKINLVLEVLYKGVGGGEEGLPRHCSVD
jgi:hypothetical protein